MISPDDLQLLTPGQNISLDLTALAHEFLTSDEWDEYRSGVHAVELGDDVMWLTISENGSDIDDPYIDLCDERGLIACDGETVEVVSNGDFFIECHSEESGICFALDYGLASAALNM